MSGERNDENESAKRTAQETVLPTPPETRAPVRDFPSPPSAAGPTVVQRHGTMPAASDDIDTLPLRRFESTMPGPTLQITGSWAGLIPKEMTQQSKYWTSNNIADAQIDAAGKNDVCVEASEEQIEDDPLIGAIIEEAYEIVGTLGKGGMAIVYLARQITTDSLVAMKAMKVNSAEDIMRFGREIRSHSRLRHRNIVQYMEFIATSTGEFFLVMERIKGLNLLDIIRSIGRIDGPANIASIMLQSCDALAYAHGNGVIHRDLKTSNVVLVKEGDSDEIVVKILDFGIAHMEGEERITFSGRAIGSPMYMSPEQCAAKTLGPRSDLYSMGVVAYEMFTGKPPYHKGSVRDIMYAHCTTDVTPKPMSELVPHIPGIKILDQIVLKALQTDPALRWDSAVQMKEAFEFWYQTVLDGDEGAESLPDHMIAERSVSAEELEDKNFEITHKERDQIRHIKRTSTMQSSFGPGKPISIDQERLQKSEEESSLKMHQAEFEREKTILVRLAALTGVMLLALFAYFSINLGMICEKISSIGKPAEKAIVEKNPVIVKPIVTPPVKEPIKKPTRKKRKRAK
jgi:serine/threonine protein kinase